MTEIITTSMSKETSRREFAKKKKKKEKRLGDSHLINMNDFFSRHKCYKSSMHRRVYRYYKAENKH